MKRRGLLKRLLPQSLFGRSLLILVLPVLLLQIISTVLFFDRHWSRMSARLAFAVAAEIAMIADQIESDGDTPERVNAIAGHAAQYLDLLVSFEPGGVLAFREGGAQGLKSLVFDILEDRMKSQVRRPFDIVVGSREKWIEISVQLKNGLLRISCPQSRLFSSSAYIFLIWTFGISGFLLAIAIAFMRNQIRPIRRLAVAAERFGKGRDVPAFKPEGAREVRQAARAFMEMHERIKRQVGQRTAMLAGVSHDLRTPLTRLKLDLAMMGDGAEVEACKGDVRAMERMIDGYLDFVRGQGDEQAARTDVRKILERVAQGAARQGHRIDVEAGPALEVSIRPVAFERCIDNIVGNACKYARNVCISANLEGEDGEMLTVLIDDDGPGIPESQYDDVFKPFYRGEPSRNPGTGGVGLGLPIAQDIVHSHGGTIELARSPAGGLRVRISMPV